MRRKLIIAEKPSVARNLAEVLGATTEEDGCITSPEWVITWCFGHLVELVEPEVYNPDWKLWSEEHLPMMPERFELGPTESGTEQFRILTKWLTDPRISGVVNACDAGREGELIFRYVYELAGSTLPMERLWIASLTTQAIEEGMRDLRPGRALEPLYHAARARNEADWLVGLNATRCVTLAARRHAKPNAQIPMISVGRVQTPTLGLLVARTRERKAFTPTPYWRLKAAFGLERSHYHAWLIEGPDATSAWRLSEEARAAGIDRVLNAQLDAAADMSARVAELEHTESKKAPPQFFDLTSLQQEANKRLGLSAKETLGAAQALYQNHQLLTYPRTDSRYITPDMVETLMERTHAALLLPSLSGLRASFAPNVQGLGKRFVNASKVTDHHAILTTDIEPDAGSLSEIERSVYEIVARRTLAALSPHAIVANTRLVTEFGGLHFLTKGRQVFSPGWMAFEGKEPGSDEDKEDAEIPRVLTQSSHPALKAAEKVKGKTKPPAAYTEATLLGAMEGAGKELEDEELKEAMKGSGLGTPATRADTIETLLKREYITRSGKSLEATELGLQVIGALEAFPHVTSAELTGRWESLLTRIAQGDVGADVFMHKVRQMTQAIITHFTEHPPKIEGLEREQLGACPACKTRAVLVSDKGLWCEGLRAKECDFVLGRTLAKKVLSIPQLKTLIATGAHPKMQGFVAKSGTRFGAPLKLVRDEERGWKFSFDFPEAEDFTGAPVVGACPACSSQVVLGPRSAKCTGEACDVRLWREICGQVLPQETVALLLRDRRTPELSGFVSKKGRSFSAAIVLEQDEERGWRFGFAEREREDLTSAPVVGSCPECGSSVHLGEREFGCSSCDVRMFRTVCGKVLAPEIVAELLRDRTTPKLSGFVSKKKKRFSTSLVLEKDPARGWRIGFPPRKGKKKR